MKIENQISEIMLQFEDGRRISIIQNKEDKNPKYIGAHGKFGHTCEVLVDGDEQPMGFLTAEQLIKFLQEKIND
tara:strand:+ start:24 stop:245 length:222 start_codon:yes stop_codon:yes gene_type:complete